MRTISRNLGAGSRGRWFAVLCAAGTILTGVLLAPTPVLAAAEDAGEVVIVERPGSSRPRTKGPSAAEFSIRLPDGASCPGDSANDNYLVQSYMVPVTVASDQVAYDGLGPAPNAYGDWATFRQPFYDTGTSPFASVLTAEAVAPGQPGPIINIPALSFKVYGPGELPPGRYRIGVACTLLNEVVRYWDGELEVEVAPGDKPAGVSWAVAGAPASAAGVSGGFLRVALAGLAAAVVITVASSRRRVRPRT